MENIVLKASDGYTLSLAVFESEPPRQQIDGNFLIQTIRGGKSVVHQNLCGAKGKAPAAGLIGNFK